MPADGKLLVIYPVLRPESNMAEHDKFFLEPSGASSYPKYREATFECRICGSKNFDELLITRRDGKRVATESFQCRGCSVVFRNWRQFIQQSAGRSQLLRFQTVLSVFFEKGVLSKFLMAYGSSQVQTLLFNGNASERN